MLKYPERPSEDVVFRDNFINEDYVDDNGGTPVNAPTIDNGLTTNGTTQYVDYGDKANLGDDNFSFSLKVSFPNAGTQEYLFSKWEDGNNRWYVRRDTTGRIFMYCVNGGVVKISAISAAGAISAANTEYHIAVSADWNDTIKFYVDGVESVGSASTFTNDDISNTGPLEVGRTSTSYGEFTMKDLTIYSKALTDEEVEDIYEADTFREIDPSNATLWLPCRTNFDDGANQVTENIGTGANVILGDGSTAGSFPTQQNPKGYEFNGVAKYLDCGDAIRTGDVTTGAMIRIDSWTETLPRLFDNGKFILLLQETGSRILLSSDGSTTSASANDTIQLGSYLHVVVTRESDGTATFYVNGEDVTNTTGSGTPATGTYNTLIGGDNITRSFYGMQTDNFIFNSILTPTQIKELSNKSFNNLNV